MNEKTRDFDDSTIQRAKRFEEICDEFESQCSAENRPSIETFLLRVETESKPSLLVELIAIEIHYRRQHGESIAFEDYQARFPEISYSWFDESVQKEFAKEPPAADQLLPLVYEELRKLAASKMAMEKPGQTLQTTALVHEVYLRLVLRQWALARSTIHQTPGNGSRYCKVFLHLLIGRTRYVTDALATHELPKSWNSLPLTTSSRRLPKP